MKTNADFRIDIFCILKCNEGENNGNKDDRVNIVTPLHSLESIKVQRCQKASELNKYAEKVKSDNCVRNILELLKSYRQMADCLYYDRCFHECKIENLRHSS